MRTGSAQHEVQEIDVSAVSTATFTLTWNGNTTSAITKATATAATVKAALEALTGLTAVYVTKEGDVYRVTFVTPVGNQAS